ncbi:hypothetical protein O181_091442 [Austropuccinia psidii MF-1]|uniref:Uncharacterized protein n=1 Tax=Austropuccinia psidii MF-1 TaxID=1389203 RepID=A0A9Q3IX99_9BASI|nr:hypothetical protein [Austropuccinia psidii MF-1]
MECNCISAVMPIFNVQPKTMDPSTPDPIPSSISRQNTQISVPDLTAIVSPTYPNTHSSLVISGSFCTNGPVILPSVHVSFQHKRTLYGQPTAYKSTPLRVPSSSDSNTKLGSNLFGSDSRIYHPMELDEK